MFCTEKKIVPKFRGTTEDEKTRRERLEYKKKSLLTMTKSEWHKAGLDTRRKLMANVPKRDHDTVGLGICELAFLAVWMTTESPSILLILMMAWGWVYLIRTPMGCVRCSLQSFKKFVKIHVYCGRVPQSLYSSSVTTIFLILLFMRLSACCNGHMHAQGRCTHAQQAQRAHTAVALADGVLFVCLIDCYQCNRD